METTAKLLADNLKRIRENKGITQEALSERLDVSVQAIGNWENGRRWPERAETIDLLCSALGGIAPAELLGGEPGVPDPRIELLKLIPQLDHETAASILEEVRDLLTPPAEEDEATSAESG